MSEEQINIAIAEACGWKWNYENASIATKSSPAMYWGKEPINPLKLVAYRQLPDYCNDLNAMHEAEKVLTEGNWKSSLHATNRYTNELCKILGCLDTALFQFAHATARKRAEAFLRTIGKWEEAAK